MEDRKKTLEALVEIASAGGDTECWHNERAEHLVRSQSSPEEFRELGISDELLRRIWPEG